MSDLLLQELRHYRAEARRVLAEIAKDRRRAEGAGLDKDEALARDQRATRTSAAPRLNRLVLVGHIRPKRVQS